MSGGTKEAELGATLIHAGLRLRFYLGESGAALLRHWQWLLLAGLLIPGSALAVLMVPAAAVEALPRAGMGAIGAWLAAAAIWILPQRRIVRGGPFAAYTGALPLPLVSRLAADVAVLLAADVLLAPVLLLAAMRGGTALLLPLAPILVLTLAVQWAAVHLPLPSWRGALRVLPLLPVARANFDALAERPLATGARVGAAWLIAGGAAGLAAAMRFDQRALPVAVIAFAAMAVLLAGLFGTLYEARRPMRELLATLPIGRWYALMHDTAAVLSVGIPPAVALLGWFGVFDPVALLPLLAIGAGYCGLVTLLRVPTIRGGRLGAMLAAGIAAGWAGSAIAMVVR